MSRILPSVCCFRRALTLAVVVFAVPFASSARAGTITYSILPNPQPDTTSDITASGGTDNVSGTITFSGVSPITGTYSSANDSGVTVASTLTVTSSNGPVVTMSGSESLATALGAGSIQLTGTSLIVNSTTQFELFNSASSSSPLIEIDWNPSNNEYQGEADAVAFNGNTEAFINTDADQYLSGGNWTIAVVPEPSSATIALIAMVGMAIVWTIGRRGNRFAVGCHAHGSA